MILLRLYYEFFKTGLFAVGGGLATVPFLQRMGAATGWFTDAELTTMIAVSESTPGPMGVNMATYVGFETAGPLGAAVATLGLVTPSILVIIVIAGVLQKFRRSKTVDAVFYGLRPASTALIASAGLSVASSVLMERKLLDPGTPVPIWPRIILTAGIFLCLRITGLKKLHPIVFIGIAALVGLVLQF